MVQYLLNNLIKKKNKYFFDMIIDELDVIMLNIHISSLQKDFEKLI